MWEPSQRPVNKIGTSTDSTPYANLQMLMTHEILFQLSIVDHVRRPLLPQHLRVHRCFSVGMVASTEPTRLTSTRCTVQGERLRMRAFAMKPRRIQTLSVTPPIWMVKPLWVF